ncbi:shiftless antiviral inhibitor of ribosomal frameshifting protein homolog isoform X2 [Mytilus californianus]|uniref:shiftless antiviral inhibitor of ribosomal frameshifting protein homolog isoform X2 n=1 Tax=Mytilus californianus TaxID=6549 RepID=UPI002245767D|nr:shiftless antiviral inhibitor of ribosomal frameshifting protein homolog isoform X2 [Mytilus californianus]
MEDNEPEIKRLQELFKGRFTFEEAQSLISHHHGDCLAAANFVIDEEPQRVRDVIGTENESWQVIANNHNWNDLVRQGIIEKQERLFACGPCDNVWWRKVPSRKLSIFRLIDRGGKFSTVQMICIQSIHNCSEAFWKIQYIGDLYRFQDVCCVVYDMKLYRDNMNGEEPNINANFVEISS